MPIVPLSIAGGFYQSRSLPFSDQRCVGWYPSYAESGSLSEAVVFGTPGTKLIASTPLPVETGRGISVMAGIPYFVNGNTLYRLDRTFDINNNEIFTLVSLGVVPGAGFVSMADNGDQLCIIAPNNSGFVYTASTGVFAQITDLGFTASGKSEGVVFIDGFFVHFAGKNIFHSLTNNALSYNSLDVGSAQADPDNIVSLIVYKNQLFALGKETIEVFANVGRFPLSFQRINGYFVPIGCSSPFSPTQFNQGFAFLGGSNKEKTGVFWGSAQNFQRISTIPIEQKLQTATDAEIEDAFTWNYSEDGGIFLGVVIADFCFVYDFNASKLAGKHIWHERRSTIPELANTQIRHRVNNMVEAYGRILVNDSFDGSIGELSINVFDEYGNFISRTLSTQPLTSQGENIFIDQIELTMESGVTVDLDNVIKLSWSDDNKTYFDPIPADIGTVGRYTLRQYWRRLGHAPRFRTFQLSYSGKDRSVLLKMEATLDTSN